MNDSELNQLLKSVKVPERGPDHWAEFPNRVSTALRATRAPQTEQRRLWPKLAWGLSFAGACVLMGFVIGHWRRAHTAQVAQNLLQSEKLIREVRALFPNQVQVVILDKQGMQLVLAEKADVPDSPAIYLNICGPDGCRQIITSSGQQIRLNGEVCDVLTDARGNIILAGQQLVWTSDSHAANAGAYRIEARSLGSSS
jgi:hypothetical protein